MVMDGDIRSVPKYMIYGQRRARGHVDYVIGIRKKEGIINARITPYSGPDAGQEFVRSEMGGPESVSKIFDVNGSILYTENKELHNGKLRGMTAKYRWLRSIAPFLREKEFDSPDDEEKKFLSPTRFTDVGFNVGKGLGTGFQTITKDKKYGGPRNKKLYFLDRGYGGENLLAFTKRDKYTEIIDHIYRRFGKTEMYFDGSKFVSDHDSIRHFLEGLSHIAPIMVMPSEANFGTDVFIRDGDESKTLVSSREDLLNTDKIVFDRPTLRVKALEKLEYEVKVHGTYWGASHLTPEYLRKSLITSSIHSRALRYPGEHMRLSALTPCVTDVEIREIGEDGEYGDFGARIRFDTDQTYKDIAVDFEYLRPERLLCALDDLGGGKEDDEFWNYLADIRQWNEYLAMQGIKQSEWLEDAEFTLKGDSVIVKKWRDVERGILNKRIEKENREIGRFTSDGDSFYFKDNEGRTVDIGKYRNNGDNPEIYTDGTEKIASVIVQKKILAKLYEKKPIGKGAKDDYALFVSFTDAHKKDGPLIVKYILTALLNVQQPLRLGPDFIEKYETVYQVPLEPAFDLLAFACYKDEDCTDEDSVFEGHDLKKYLGIGEELDADTTKDLAFGFQKIFPNRVTDEDVRNFLDEPEVVVAE